DHHPKKGMNSERGREAAGTHWTWFSVCYARRERANPQVERNLLRGSLKKWQPSQVMRTREFLSKLDHDKIVKAIAHAEARTSGEIRVYLQRGELEADALDTAKRQFRRFGMHQTAERNAVLIFIAPRARKFAVVADSRAYQKCGGDYWQHLVETM